MPAKIVFTKEQTEDIIYLYSVHYKPLDIAKKYDCSLSTISRLLKLNGINISKQYLYVLQSHHICCTSCQTIKHFDEFYNKSGSKFGKHVKCKECIDEKNSRYESSNKDKIIQYRKTYRSDNRDRINRRMKTYNYNNKDKVNEYRRNRYKADSSYQLLCKLRRRLAHALVDNTKSARTLELLGCSIEELKEHLQFTAIQNGYNDFDIENYSGYDYHIDHIIPCVSFNLEDVEEQRRCFHWSNLQILTAKDNLKKSDTY